VADLTADRVARNLEEIREEIGPDVEVVAAVKYLQVEDLQALADAGLTTVGENRAQELERKAAAYPGVFTWDFIGQLQSRKVKVLAPLVRRIHSLASDSALKELGKLAAAGDRMPEILIEVNIAEEEGKAGIAPAELDAFLERARAKGIEPAGLMTMPPQAETPEDSRRWFAALRELARDRSLPQLSMGTTQDYAVAAQEGATTVRIGSRLYR
jgi:pyridoxal phosphate enzyme (YggS family)